MFLHHVLKPPSIQHVHVSDLVYQCVMCTLSFSQTVTKVSRSQLHADELKLRE